MKILVIGKNGQLGQSFNKIIEDLNHEHKFTFTGRSEIDLSNTYSINNYFKDHNFDVIINCAAYTDVDNAELQAESANLINNKAVELLAEISNKNKSKFIHISTDYVFDGKKEQLYNENDQTNPINAYGKTKLLGENKIISLMPENAIIIRTSWLYSNYGKNFVDSIIKNALKHKKIDVINDQYGSPTYSNDLVDVLLKIIETLDSKKTNIKTQIYHFSGEGNISWFDFACEIVRIAKIECIVNPINSNQYPSLANRPQNTSLNLEKITKEFNLDIKNWKTSLVKYMDLLNTN